MQRVKGENAKKRNRERERFMLEMFVNCLNIVAIKFIVFAQTDFSIQRFKFPIVSPSASIELPRKSYCVSYRSIINWWKFKHQKRSVGLINNIQEFIANFRAWLRTFSSLFQYYRPCHWFFILKIRYKLEYENIARFSKQKIKSHEMHLWKVIVLIETL